MHGHEEDDELREVLFHLPGRDCGLCGYPACRGLALRILLDPKAIEKCPYREGEADSWQAKAGTEEIS